MTNYRPLLDKEIATLTVYGCSAQDWKQVQVVEDFSPSYFYNVHFSGQVFLGSYNKIFELPGGVRKHAGVCNCLLHNCTVGNDVFIDKINNYIANYEIADGAYIENINLLLTEGESTFGNGTEAAVLVESGGRTIPIFDWLSAPMAYMLTFYKYNSKAIDAITHKINTYADLQKSDKGRIGKNARIVNCDTLKNVRVGDFTTVEGALRLENGTINSNEQAPVYIGQGVQCTNFIINSGTTISEAALVSNCFVGQGCILGKQFSAMDSLFFANCQGLHGEAASVFAGPYTVTHHKSTLMLTALYSFMNAGSGTNFSNHMYKLGPIHQGITERGVKTSSDSYMMWPAKIGAFTMVLGRHKGNPDISDLPFSYLIENNGESNLLPGVNLHSAGTIRDVLKWPKRDNRTDDLKLDPINFDFLSPYTLGKALKGIEILKQLLESANTPFVWYQNCKIKRSSMKKGIEVYQMAIDQFIGEKIAAHIKSKTDLSNLKQADNAAGTGDWVDMVGLITPKSEINKLLVQVTDEAYSLKSIQEKLNALQSGYDDYAWNWTKALLPQFTGKALAETEAQDLIPLIENWKKAAATFSDLIIRDAKKEFNAIARTGFGLDGNEEEVQLDFEAVRGTVEENAFIQDMSKGLDKSTAVADQLIEILKS